MDDLEQRAKKLAEKMADFRRFAIILLAVGVFFYLGVIIPSDKSEMDLNIMMMASMSLLAISIFLFIQAKKCQLKLMDMEEGNDQMNQR
ncbi:YrhC family protein [Bacillus sp. MRMR6]|uniref:YrhC family protein n=1 Tax=Bacillus sp. MRMR6 TaxID=1928617 RepID=UPI0020CA0C11|nr:YrhC family protein [Bacillus sp. MRMR6]